ncbi:unnamed protein product, partial [Mesorhabditis spiculigera]
MAQIVNPTGGLVANIVAYENPDFKEEEIRKLFSKYFASCFLMKYLPEQRMLICSHRPEWTLKTQRKNVCHLIWEEVLFICVAGCRVEEELSSDRFRKWLAETVEHSKNLKGIFLLGWLEGCAVDLQRKTAIRPKDEEAVKPFLDLIEDNCLTNLWIHRQNCFLLGAQDFQVQVHHEVFAQRMGEEFKNASSSDWAEQRWQRKATSRDPLGDDLAADFRRVDLPDDDAQLEGVGFELPDGDFTNLVWNADEWDVNGGVKRKVLEEVLNRKNVNLAVILKTIKEGRPNPILTIPGYRVKFAKEIRTLDNPDLNPAVVLPDQTRMFVVFRDDGNPAPTVYGAICTKGTRVCWFEYDRVLYICIHRSHGMITTHNGGFPEFLDKMIAKSRNPVENLRGIIITGVPSNPNYDFNSGAPVRVIDHQPTESVAKNFMKIFKDSNRRFDTDHVVFSKPPTGIREQLGMRNAFVLTQTEGASPGSTVQLDGYPGIGYSYKKLDPAGNRKDIIGFEMVFFNLSAEAVAHPEDQAD